MFRYSPEQLDWLRSSYPSMSQNELVVAFNKYFKTDRPATSILACLKNHNITSGRTGCFKKGQKAWNEGLKGFMGANATSFKKGRQPHNTRELWSERVSKDGYIEISVPERNPHTGFKTRFKPKHVWIWEQENGPKPKSTAIIFKDGDYRNFEIDNLILVTRSELLSLNLNGYKQALEEVKPSILALSKIEAKAGFRTRPGRGREKLL